MGIHNHVSLVGCEKLVNELLDFGVTQFSLYGSVRNRYYVVEQWISPSDVLTKIYIYYDGKADGRDCVDIVITIKRCASRHGLPEKHYIEVYWRYPRSMSRSRELSFEEYSKLMEGIANLLKVLSKR